ncbi:MAG: hypothetical protein L0Y72_09380 [Gemmataceae bacterium]|nr:hypothetical protein [Gemmataceae bacterium]MCI0739243.1 hypothetical protein [Gemmataceae bacterium]
MHYKKTAPFDGNAAKAFDLATAALTSLGFRTVARSNAMLEVEGPGMMSSRQSALLGASRIKISHGNRQLDLEAELGGVRRLARFVTWFPLGLSLALAVILSVVFSMTQNKEDTWIFPVAAVACGNAAIWLVAGPLMVRHIHRRTCRDIDTLLQNMVQMGKMDG